MNSVNERFKAARFINFWTMWLLVAAANFKATQDVPRADIVKLQTDCAIYS